MKIQKAIEFIEDLEVSERLEEARNTLKQNLSQLSKTDFEAIGTHYYYLLRVTLRSHILFEKDSSKLLYRKMKENFKKQEEKYKKQYLEGENKDIVRIQMQVFYKMMERYFSSLEVVYDKKDFLEARQRAFEDKMRFRKNAHVLNKEYLTFLGYKFLELSSNYRQSFTRWGMTSLAFTVFFALIFASADLFGEPALNVNHWYDYFHFSVATFTTLGYGDIAAMNLFGKMISNLEVFIGYGMLGLLLGLVQKKLFS